MVERGGLENRCARERTVGSNPTPSASFQGFFDKKLLLKLAPWDTHGTLENNKSSETVIDCPQFIPKCRCSSRIFLQTVPSLSHTPIEIIYFGISPTKM